MRPDRGPIRTHPSILMNAARCLRHEILDRQAKTGDLEVKHSPLGECLLREVQYGR